MAFIWGGNYFWLDFRNISTGDTGLILYHRDIGDNDYMRVVFKNQPGGENVGDNNYAGGSAKSRYYGNASLTFSQSARDNRTKTYSLEQFVDPSKRPTEDLDEMVHFYGTKSGTSGAGNLNVIKTQAGNFYTELPDAIIATTNDGWECILRLKFVDISNAGDNDFFYERVGK